MLLGLQDLTLLSLQLHFQYFYMQLVLLHISIFYFHRQLNYRIQSSTTNQDQDTTPYAKPKPSTYSSSFQPHVPTNTLIHSLLSHSLLPNKNMSLLIQVSPRIQIYQKVWLPFYGSTLLGLLFAFSLQSCGIYLLYNLNHSMQTFNCTIIHFHWRISSFLN